MLTAHLNFDEKSIVLRILCKVASCLCNFNIYLVFYITRTGYMHVTNGVGFNPHNVANYHGSNSR